MKRILLTGFDPFGGESINPSYEAVRRLPDSLPGITLRKLQIPTVFGVGAAKVMQAVDEFGPDVIICVGQAGGRARVTPERIALNVREASIPDNAGNSPRHEIILPDAPTAYATDIDVPAIVAALNQERPTQRAAVSYHAGTFVCNDVYFNLLHRVETERKQGRLRKGLFVHVPYIPEQVKTPGTSSMPLEDITATLLDLVTLLSE